MAKMSNFRLRDQNVSDMSDMSTFFGFDNPRSKAGSDDRIDTAGSSRSRFSFSYKDEQEECFPRASQCIFVECLGWFLVSSLFCGHKHPMKRRVFSKWHYSIG
jgi:hypothetical protein